MTSFKILLNRKEFLYVRIINNFVVLKSLKDAFKRYPVLDLSNMYTILQGVPKKT